MAENASPGLTNENTAAAQKLQTQQLPATISNLFMTGALQANAQALLNITITGLAVIVMLKSPCLKSTIQTCVYIKQGHGLTDLVEFMY